MKKVISLLLIFIICFSLVGCTITIKDQRKVAKYKITDFNNKIYYAYKVSYAFGRVAFKTTDNEAVSLSGNFIVEELK